MLKLPHHGNRHNTSKEFLQAVRVDRYIVSASGRYRHPSRQTLEWIAKVAREQGQGMQTSSFVLLSGLCTILTGD